MAGGVGVLALVGQIGLVGMQTQFRENARQDALVAKRLETISPNVGAGTSFLILGVEHPPARASHPAYNAILHSPLREDTAATPFLRQAMRRDDVLALTGIHGGRSLVLVDHLSLQGVHNTGFVSCDLSVPWTNIVPLWIDEQARVHVIEMLTVVPLNRSPLLVRPARAEELVRVMAATGISSADGIDLWQKHVRLVETSRGNSRVVLETGEPTTGQGPDGR